MTAGIKVFEPLGYELAKIQEFDRREFRTDYVLPLSIHNERILDTDRMFRVVAALADTTIVGLASFAPSEDGERFEVASLAIRTGQPNTVKNVADVGPAMLYNGGLIAAQREGMRLGAYVLSYENGIFSSAGFRRQRVKRPVVFRRQLYVPMQKDIGAQQRMDQFWKARTD